MCVPSVTTSPSSISLLRLDCHGLWPCAHASLNIIPVRPGLHRLRNDTSDTRAVQLYRRERERYFGVSRESSALLCLSRTCARVSGMESGCRDDGQDVESFHELFEADPVAFCRGNEIDNRIIHGGRGHNRNVLVLSTRSFGSGNSLVSRWSSANDYSYRI